MPHSWPHAIRGVTTSGPGDSRAARATVPTIGSIAIRDSKITAAGPADGVCARLAYRGAALEPEPRNGGCRSPRSKRRDISWEVVKYHGFFLVH